MHGLSTIQRMNAAAVDKHHTEQQRRHVDEIRRRLLALGETTKDAAAIARIMQHRADRRREG